MKSYIAGALLFLALTSAAQAENRTTSGELFVEPPTLIALGLEWSIEGDDNRNAHVAMSYRKKGTEKWSRALDPLRLSAAPRTWERTSTAPRFRITARDR